MGKPIIFSPYQSQIMEFKPAIFHFLRQELTSWVTSTWVVYILVKLMFRLLVEDFTWLIFEAYLALPISHTSGSSTIGSDLFELSVESNSRFHFLNSVCWPSGLGVIFRLILKREILAEILEFSRVLWLRIHYSFSYLNLFYLNLPIY